MKSKILNWLRRPTVTTKLRFASKRLFLTLFLSWIFLIRATPLWAVAVGFVYVQDYNRGAVLAYSFDDATGALTEVPGSPFAVGLVPFAVGPITITVDPTGQFLYAIVLNVDGVDGVKVFTIDGATGALTLAPGPPVPTGGGRTNPVSMAVDPTGQFLYVANSNGPVSPPGSLAAFTIDANTGRLTPINQSPPPARLGAGPWSAAVDPTGQYLYVVNSDSNDITAFSIDAQTGAAFTIPGSPFPAPGDPPQYTGGAPRQLVVRPDGQFLYVAVDRQPSLIQELGIDPGGELRRVIGSPFATGANNVQLLAMDPRGQFLYVPAPTDFIVAYTVDFLSGNLFPVPGSPFRTAPGSNRGIAVDPTAQFVYVTGGLGFDLPAAIFGFSIEADGSLTPVPGSPFIVDPTRIGGAGVIVTTARRIFP